LKIFGTGYDYEEEDLSTPFEHRIQSTKAVLFFQAPAFILITYILSLGLRFQIRVLGVVCNCILPFIINL